MKYKRTNYVINKSLQYRLIASVMLSVVLSFGVFALGSVLLFSGMEGGHVELLVTSPETGEVKEVSFSPLRMWTYTLPAVLINNLIIMVIVSLEGLRLTNRIAGPVYHIKNDVERVLAGQEGVQTQLRPGDRFEDLADEINRLFSEVDGLRKK